MVNKKLPLFNIDRFVRKKVLIGVMGTHTGSGVTHTVLMLAAFLNHELGMRGAVLELNSNNEFQYLEDEDSEKVKNMAGFSYFIIQEVSFFKNVKAEELALLYHLDYEFFILDLGSEQAQYMKEFLRCDYTFIITSLSDWKGYRLMRFIRNHSKILMNTHIEYMAVFGNRFDCKKTKKKLEVSIQPLLYEPDPFYLSKSTKKLFYKLLV